MASLWFSSANSSPTQSPGEKRGPKCSCSWHEMKGSGKRAWCLRAGGGLGNRLSVCPSSGCLLSLLSLLPFPRPLPHHLMALCYMPQGRGAGGCRHIKKYRCLGCQEAPSPNLVSWRSCS